MIELETSIAKLETFVLSLRMKFDGKSMPKATEDALGTLKSTLAGMLIARKEMEELHKDWKIKEQSVVYHSLNCAKLTAMNASKICTIARLTKENEELKRGL